MSSDHGFIPLYQYLQQRGKKVVVAGDVNLNKNDIKAITDRIIVLDTDKPKQNKPAAKADQTTQGRQSNQKQNAQKQHAQTQQVQISLRPAQHRPEPSSTRGPRRNATARGGSSDKRCVALNKSSKRYRRKRTLDRMYSAMKGVYPRFSVRKLGYSRLYDLLLEFPETVAIRDTGLSAPTVRYPYEPGDKSKNPLRNKGNRQHR